MAKAKSVKKQRYWWAVVRRQEGSGLSVAAFCRSEGVSEASFYAWKRRLTRDAGQVSGTPRPAMPKTATRAAQKPRSKPASETAPLASGFVPVRISDEPRRAMFHVRWPGGLSVRIPTACDRADVEVVLAAVDRLARQCREDEPC